MKSKVQIAKKKRFKKIIIFNIFQSLGGGKPYQHQCQPQIYWSQPNHSSYLAPSFTEVHQQSRNIETSQKITMVVVRVQCSDNIWHNHILIQAVLSSKNSFSCTAKLKVNEIIPSENITTFGITAQPFQQRGLQLYDILLLI